MRRAALVVSGIVCLAAAAPAAAQVGLTPQQRASVQMQLNELQAQTDLARQRDIASHNQLMSLDARLRTEQSIADVRTQAYIPRLPPANAYQTAPDKPLPAIDTSQIADIPDAALADSNRRVREASGGGR